MKLSELKKGDCATITGIKGSGAFRRRINEMGFIVGKQIETVKRAPMRDPVEYRVMGYNVSIRIHEAEMISVEKVRPFAQASGDMKKVQRLLADTAIQRITHFCEAGHRQCTCGNVPGSSHGARSGISYNPQAKTINVALVGNPNSGKTTLFNHATRSRERVANYGGVTVAAKEAEIRYKGYRICMTDLPGTYSLSSYSPEEMFVTDHLINGQPDIVLNVIDAGNLERNLYLTTQLIDMESRIVVALNMYDELKAGDDRFDHHLLGNMLGIPFVPTIGTRGKGMNDLLETIIRVHEDRESVVRKVPVHYGQDIEKAVAGLANRLNGEIPASHRFVALKLLEGDTVIEGQVKSRGPAGLMDRTARQKKDLAGLLGKEAGAHMIDVRYGFINGALQETFTHGESTGKKVTARIDGLLTHRVLGLPVFFLFVWFIFFCTFKVGQYPMDWIGSGIGRLSRLATGVMPAGVARDLLVDGILGGLGGVIVFLPNIMILFLLISFMEDVGYMARTAFLMDKTMHRAGLHGKSFIPLLMGFGCNVPAIMATRTIESKRDRKLTILVIPFMSCSARLPVYVLFISAFFPFHRSMLLFVMYLTGILAALITAVLFNKTVLKQEDSPFVMELPPYRIPTLKAVAKHTWFKTTHFLRKMGGVILVASIVIWALGYFPRDKQIIGRYNAQISALKQEHAGRTGQADESSNPELKAETTRLEAMKRGELLEQSYISRLGRFIQPVFEPLGFDWKMTVSILTGTLAKEIVVSSMGVLYQAGAGAGENDPGLIAKLRRHREEQRIPLVTYFGFLVFVLLYFPCVGTLTAIRKETEKVRWMLVTAAYPLVFAWIVTFVIYRVGLFLA